MGGEDGGPIHTTNFDPIIEILKADLSIQSTEIHYNIAVGPKAGINIGLPKGDLGIGFGVRLDVVRVDNKWSEYKSKRPPPALSVKRLELNHSRAIALRKPDLYQTDVTSACTEPKGGEQKDGEPKEREEAFENAFGFTMDLKTGIYAFLNLAGFYVDTNWIGDKVGSDFSGLYWGIKSLVAKCGDCGEEQCLSQKINDVLDVAIDGLGFIDSTFRVSELTDSDHVSKDSILSLNDQMVGEDMPTGNPDVACYAKPASGISRRTVFGDEDVNVCQPK